MVEEPAIKRIRRLVRAGALKEPFTAADVNRALKIAWAGVFLSSHRTDNPLHRQELFVRVARGKYRLNPDTRIKADTASWQETEY